MKRIKIPILLLIFVFAFSLACNDEVHKTAEAYLQIEHSLVDAHKAGAISEDTWAQISHIRNSEGKPAYDTMLEAWDTYGQSKDKADYEKAIAAAKTLQSVIATLKQMEGK